MITFHIQCLLLLLSTTQTRAVQDNDESSNDSSNRTTWDIVWSFLATIFTCNWLAVHPNVPSRYMREKGRLFLGLHRVKHMLLAIICPEAVVMWAFRQRLVASVLSKHLKLSMTHSFFISMGGFVGKDDRTLTAADFISFEDFHESVKHREMHFDLDISPISSVTKEELMDKSKGDALSKGISLLQTTWFVVQYFSRRTLSLPTTPLETATLAFALLNFCNYILWWHKPLDVQYPLSFPTIYSPPPPNLRFHTGRHKESNLWIPLARLPTSKVSRPENRTSPSSTSTSKHQLSVDYDKNHSSELVCFRECLECDISSPTAVSINDWRFFHAEAGSIIDELSRRRGADERSGFQTATYSIDILPLHAKSGKPRRRYRLWFHQTVFILIPPLCVRVWRWYRRIFGTIIHGEMGTRSPDATLPMLWAGQPRGRSQMRDSAFFGGCCGALFGGVHCIGWSSSGFFVSSLEHLLWKISSLSIAVIPVILAFAILIILPKYYLKLRGILIRFVGYSHPILVFIYICARIYLLVDMFVSLRSLPPGALEEIDWTRYIPHI